MQTVIQTIIEPVQAQLLQFIMNIYRTWNVWHGNHGDPESVVFIQRVSSKVKRSIIWSNKTLPKSHGLVQWRDHMWGWGGGEIRSIHRQNTEEFAGHIEGKYPFPNSDKW